MKPDPYRLDLATYPFTIDIQPRFGDMDALRHLNNVALAQVYEEGRLRFAATFGHHPTGGDDGHPMLAEVTIRYLAEARYPDMLTVGVGVLHVGRTSYRIGHGLFQRGHCIGISDTVVVWTSDGKPAPIPHNFRAALDAARIALPAEA